MTPPRPHVLTNEHRPHLFAVVTWGCCGSMWLSRTLASHPDMFCVHAFNSHIVLEVDTRGPVDGVPYLGMLGLQGHGFVAAGDVHGVSRHTVPELRAVFAAGFDAAVLVRDPVPRLLSQLALFELYHEERRWLVDYVDPIAEAAGIRCTTYWERLVVHGANLLNAILEEVEVGPVFRIEDLASEPESLRRLVRHLTGGRIEPARAWAAGAVGRPALNRHGGSRRALTAEQREVVRAIVRPEAWALYGELGYDSPGWL